MDGEPQTITPDIALDFGKTSSRAVPIQVSASAPAHRLENGEYLFEDGANLTLTITPCRGQFPAGRYRLCIDQRGNGLPILEGDLGLVFTDGEMALPIRFKPCGKESDTAAIIIIPREATGVILRPKLSAMHQGQVTISSLALTPVSRSRYYADLFFEAGASPWDRARLLTAVGTRTARDGLSGGAALLRQVEVMGLDALRSEVKPATGTDGHDPYMEDLERPRSHWLCMEPFSPGAQALVLAAYCSDGRLTRAQATMLRRYGEAGLEPLLVIATDNYDPYLDPGDVPATRIMIRENRGFDFGSWRDALSALGGTRDLSSLTLTNDSVWPISVSALRTVRERTGDADVTFLTRNPAVRNHGQSYFLTLSQDAIHRGSFSTLFDIPYQDDKTRLIFDHEIKLSAKLEAMGFTTETLFPTETQADPSIAAWDQLIRSGFPFVKLQLFRQGILSLANPELDGVLSEHDRETIGNHLKHRTHPIRTLPPRSGLNVSSFEEPHPFNEAGVQNAWNPPPAERRPLEIPLEESPVSTPGILGIIHCFYLDEAETILDLVVETGVAMRLILTTDTDEKRSALTTMLAERGIDGEVVLCPNQGRDVAPFLIELGRDNGREPLIFHLHTKKSKHNDRYKGWGPYLRHHLIGSRNIVRSILRLFEEPSVGIVYPEHFPEIRDARNWGYNFNRTRALLERLGIQIDARTPLEFPTGTMFFARREVLLPLLELNLTYDDFDEEAGQVDGTLAHGIERSLIYLAEARGFRSVSVLDPHAYPPTEGITPVKSSDLRYYIKSAARRLIANGAMSPPFVRSVRQVYPVATARSEETRRRMTLLVPTLKPDKVYGGISTALTSFRRLIEAAPPETDTRVIVTSDKVDSDSLDLCADRLGMTAVRTAADQERVTGIAVVPLNEERSRPIALRRNEVLMATAWWTADLGFRLLDAQRESLGETRKLVYLIQDFEPAFYEAGATAALAEATYQRPDDTIALLNSEELAATFSSLTREEQRMVLPFSVNASIEQHLRPENKEPMILCYGRPSTPRNAFPLLVDALKLFVGKEPGLADGWRIIFAGEDFPKSEIGALPNSEVVGKLSLESYAGLLSRSAVGVSLMISPHPSYPPLEMARAGCEVVTNGYGKKDLSLRARNIISVSPLTPETLSEGIAQAVRRAKPGTVVPLQELSAPPLEGWPVFNAPILSSSLWD